MWRGQILTQVIYIQEMCSEETGRGLWIKELPPCDAQLCCCYSHYYFLKGPQWGTANAESNVPSVANPELTSALSLKPGVGQNIASHASPNARIFFLVLILNSSLSSSKASPYFLTALVLADAVFHVGPRNKTDHPAPVTHDLSRLPW